VRGLAPAVHGAVQADNVAVAVAAIEVLRESGRFGASDADLVDVLGGITLRGRLETIGMRPRVVVDGAHTPQSVALAFADVRRLWPSRKTVVLFGMAADKDWASAAAQLAAADLVVSTRYDHVRAVAAEDLAEAVRAGGGRAGAEADVRAGLARARREAGPDGVVFVVGSLYLVAEVRSAGAVDGMV
jgi:dihydrofolate synthase/folylpolyglutamate synthase